MDTDDDIGFGPDTDPCSRECPLPAVRRGCFNLVVLQGVPCVVALCMGVHQVVHLPSVLRVVLGLGIQVVRRSSMLCRYVVKLHVHCSIHDGYARSTGSKTSAHAVLRGKNKLLVLIFTDSQGCGRQILPTSVGAMKKGFSLANLPGTVKLTVLFRFSRKRNIGNLLSRCYQCAKSHQDTYIQPSSSLPCSLTFKWTKFNVAVCTLYVLV